MPGPDSIVFGGPPGWVVGAWQWATGRADFNSTTAAQIRLAQQAGYTGTRDQLIAVGQGLYSRDAFALGQGAGPGGDRIAPGPPRLPAVIPQPSPIFYPPTSPAYQPPPPGSGGSGSSGQGVPPPRGGTPGINPNAPPPAGAGPASIIPWLILGQTLPSLPGRIGQANDWLSWVINRAVFGPAPIPKGPRNRRGRPPDAPPGRGDPFPPQGPPVNVTINMPQPREPYAERVARAMEGLGDIYVSTRRLPVPTPPAPSVPPKPLWQQLLPLIGGPLLSFLQPAAGDKNILRLTDPLSQPQPLTSTQTSVSSFGAFGGPSGSTTCECKQPRKKGRKKKRVVCYSGTFTEKASGIRKVKKRKVKCT